MSDHTIDLLFEDQEPGWERKKVRSLLDELIVDSRMYTSGASYKALLDFVVKLPNFAPFNAMLLQVEAGAHVCGLGVRVASDLRASSER